MTSDTYVHDVDNTAQSPTPPKMIYAGDAFSGQPTVVTTDEGIYLAADKTNVIAITPDFGVHLTGDFISLSGNPNQILIGGGYWCLNPLLLTCLPSTSATPIPTLVRTNPPVLASQDAMSGCLSFLGSNGL